MSRLKGFGSEFASPTLKWKERALVQLNAIPEFYHRGW